MGKSMSQIPSVLDGNDAFAAGKGLNDNPHPKGSPKYILWNNGWNRGFDEKHGDTSQIAKSIFGRLAK